MIVNKLDRRNKKRTQPKIKIERLVKYQSKIKELNMN
jgi:hypothetical protein